MPRPKNPALDPADVGKLDRDVYSTLDLAHRLQVNKETVQDWIRAERDPLPAIYLGGSAGYRVTHADLMRWLQRHRGLKVADAPARPVKSRRRAAPRRARGA